MLPAVLLLSVLCLFLACILVIQARVYFKRETALLDRLLKQAGVAPLRIERENVVKLPDPEIQPASWIDESFFVDEIKEELEQQYPELARMSHGEARARYPHDWARVQKKLQAEKAPFRAD